jgi:TolB-like protein/DNA-binding winged helix-turn-helix (wHTH) protein
MTLTPAQSRVVKFGVFEVDLETRELRKSGVRQKLVGQPFQVLQVLLEHPQEIVSRHVLQQRIWPQNTFVDYDLALKKAVNRVREVLGDSAESPRFIETVPRQGYRFIAPLNQNGQARLAAELPTNEAPAANQSPGRRLQIGLVIGLGLVILLLTLVGLKTASFWGGRSGASATPQIRSLAVLPFQNLSADPAQEYFSDGLTDALITNLAQIGSLSVISRTSTVQYKGTKEPLPEIARELNVDGIIEGTVQRSGNRVRITAQLIYARSDKHLWAQNYERDVQDVFTLEREVTGDIAHQVQARVTTPSKVPVQQPSPMNPKVLEAYLQGNYHLNRQFRGGGDEEKKKAAEYFQQVIDADPNFAPAYNGLANAHFILLWPSSQDAEIVRTAAERATELDPTLSDARVTLGSLLLCSWDFRVAEDELRQALVLNPSNANAHDLLGQLLYDIGHSDEGWREIQIAQELDPNQDHLSFALQNQREYDRAIAWLLIMSKRDPDSAYIHDDLFRSYAGKGMYKEAFQELEKAASLVGFPQIAAHVHHAFAISGYRGGMQQFAKEMEHLAATKQMFMPVNVAEIYASLGDKDRALYWLEEAFRNRNITAAAAGVGLEMINVDPMMDPLRSDPRFKDLLRRIGLPQ